MVTSRAARVFESRWFENKSTSQKSGWNSGERRGGPEGLVGGEECGPPEEGSGERAMPLLRKKNLNLSLKMACFGEF